nr:hypothetical protein [Tanacetum cinerariifolium]
MRPFGCPVTILNTKDHLGEFDGKVDEGFFIGYSLNSKAFRVFNSRTRLVEANLHIRFYENTPNVVGSRPDWLFDIGALTRTMNYDLIVAGTQSNNYLDPSKGNECDDQEKEDNVNNTNNVNTVSSTVNAACTNKDNELPFDPNMLALEDVGTFDFSNEDEDDNIVADMNNMDTTIQVTPIPSNSCIERSKLDRGYAGRASTIQVIRSINFSGFTKWKRAIGTKWVFRNKKDEKGIVIRNKIRLVAQGHTHKEGIDYDAVFAFVARIEAIRLFLAYTSFKDFMVYQMDVKSAFLYGKTKEEKNDGIFISQDKYVAESLKKFRFIKVKNASTPMETQKPLLKDEDGEEVDVHMYRSMIGSLTYLTSSGPDIMYLKGQPKPGLWYPKDSLFDLVAYTDSDYARENLDRKSTTGVLVYYLTKTINEESQIHARVDGKEIIITESFVMRDLRLADEEGVDCLPNFTIFENLELMRKPKRKVTKVPQPSDPTEHVANEAVYKELDDRLSTPNEASSLGTTLGGGPRCQEAMGDTIAQTRFGNVSKLSNDSLLARGGGGGAWYEGDEEMMVDMDVVTKWWLPRLMATRDDGRDGVVRRWLCRGGGGGCSVVVMLLVDRWLRDRKEHQRRKHSAGPTLTLRDESG